MGREIQILKRVAATIAMGIPFTIGCAAFAPFVGMYSLYNKHDTRSLTDRNKSDDNAFTAFLGGIVLSPFVAMASPYIGFKKAHEIACDKISMPISMPKQENSNEGNSGKEKVLSRSASINPIKSDVNVNAEYTTDSENDLRSLSDDSNHQKEGSGLLSSLHNVDDNNTHPNVVSHAIGPHQPTNSALHPDTIQRAMVQSNKPESKGMV